MLALNSGLDSPSLLYFRASYSFTFSLQGSGRGESKVECDLETFTFGSINQGHFMDSMGASTWSQSCVGVSSAL